MPSFFRSAATLALAGAAAAFPNPSNADACAAAVTGKAALGDDKIRRDHCSSFIKTIVTPSAIVVTTTITDAPEPTGWNAWKRATVTVCPNEVPNYASACDAAGYKKACSAWGVTGETTITIPATTSTKTVYVNGGKGNGNGKGDCTATVTKAVNTATVTVTAAQTTVTVTKGGDSEHPQPTGSKCLNKAKAEEFVKAFKDLLEFTDYAGTQGPPGRGYHYNVSKKYLAEDFKDYSDSINWMAGFPQGSLTFPSRAAFDQGQGKGQPELKVTTQFISFSCNEITWKWSAQPPTRVNVMGINHMILTPDNSQIAVNHAEFNNAIWINSFDIPGASCQIPRAPASNSTSPAARALF